MKYILFFAFALFSISAAAAGAKVSSKKDCPKPVCFYKKQKCCYNFKVGDTEIKRVKCYKPCKVKKCEQKCVDKCENVCKKVPKVSIKKECKDEEVVTKDCHYGHCTPKKKIVKVCCDKKVTTMVDCCKKVCKPCCKDVCEYVTAYKIIVKKIEYTTFVPKLKCDKIKDPAVPKPLPYKTTEHIGSVPGGKVHKKPSCNKC